MEWSIYVFALLFGVVVGRLSCLQEAEGRAVRRDEAVSVS